MNLNKVFVLGNLTRDPELRSLPSGQPVVSFGIATNRFYTDASGEKKQDVEFHNIVAFGKLADTISRYLKKGGLALIEGRLKTRNWQDASGVKHYKTEVIAEGLQLGPKPTGAPGNYSGNYNNSNNEQKPFSKQNQAIIKQGPAMQTGDIPVIEEKIPVIEENYTPPPPAQESSIPENFSAETDADEIDIKDIPF